MLTLNAYKFMATSICGTQGGNFKKWNGSTASGMAGYYMNSPTKRLSKCLTATPGNSSGVIFGNGNAPVTINDYCLAGDIIKTISATSTVSNGYDDTGEYVTATYTITNTGTSEITISEVGFYQYSGSYTPLTSTGTTSTTGIGVLIDRTVLDTPVTIPAGGVGQVTYTVRCNYPTA